MAAPLFEVFYRNLLPAASDEAPSCRVLLVGHIVDPSPFDRFRRLLILTSDEQVSEELPRPLPPGNLPASHRIALLSEPYRSLEPELSTDTSSWPTLVRTFTHSFFPLLPLSLSLSLSLSLYPSPFTLSSSFLELNSTFFLGRRDGEKRTYFWILDLYTWA